MCLVELRYGIYTRTVGYSYCNPLQLYYETVLVYELQYMNVLYDYLYITLNTCYSYWGTDYVQYDTHNGAGRAVKFNLGDVV